MDFQDLLISTGVIQLMEMVWKKREIPLHSCAGLLELPRMTVEDWALIMEEEGFMRREEDGDCGANLVWVSAPSEKVESLEGVFMRRKAQLLHGIKKGSETYADFKRRLAAHSREAGMVVEEIRKRNGNPESPSIHEDTTRKLEELSSNIEGLGARSNRVKKNFGVLSNELGGIVLEGKKSLDAREVPAFGTGAYTLEVENAYKHKEFVVAGSMEGLLEQLEEKIRENGELRSSLSGLHSWTSMIEKNIKLLSREKKVIALLSRSEEERRKLLEADSMEAKKHFNKGNALFGALPDYCPLSTSFSLQEKDAKSLVEALKEFNRAVWLDPSIPGLYYNRGRCFRALRQYLEAAGDYKRALEAGPESPEILSELGYAFIRMGEHSRALEQLNKAVSLKPDCAQAYLFRGFLYGMMEKFGEAASDFSRAIGLGHGKPEAYYWRGYSYSILDQEANAIRDYRKALELDPGNEDAKRGLDRLLNPKDREGNPLPGQLKEREELEFDGTRLLVFPETGFSVVGGMEKLKERLRLEVRIAMDEAARKEAAALGIGAPAALVLYGAPGTGKTAIVEALAGEMGCNLVFVRISEILSKWVGRSERNVSALFEYARRNQPAILFFDEADALGGSREHMEAEHQRVFLANLLNEMDLHKKRKEKVFIIGATNMPWKMDGALLRSGRFGKSILVEEPDEAAREGIFRIYLSRINQKEEDMDYAELARISSGLTGANIEHVCGEVAKEVLRRRLAGDAGAKVGTEGLRMAVVELTKRKTDVQIWKGTVRSSGVDLECFPELAKYFEGDGNAGKAYR
jgi:ATP-dependent 26S proteasome regulatory subunit/Flp pilus assembly protein TadD